MLLRTATHMNDTRAKTEPFGMLQVGALGVEKKLPTVTCEFGLRQRQGVSLQNMNIL